MESSSTKKVCNQWLAQARSNFRAAAVTLRDPLLYEVSCYHAHQAAEMAIKAYLFRDGGGLLRIHDVEYLITLCMKTGQEFRALIPDAIYLNPFYLEMNYPILDPVKVSRRIPQNALKSAKKIIQLVERSLSKPNSSS